MLSTLVRLSRRLMSNYTLILYKTNHTIAVPALPEPPRSVPARDRNKAKREELGAGIGTSSMR